MVVMRVFAVLVVLCAASPAHAEQKSETTAVALSVAPFLAGAGLLTTAAIMYDLDTNRATWTITATGGAVLVTAGPTFGRAYAGRVWSSGLAVRLVAAGIAIPGMLLVHYGDNCGDYVCGAQVAGMGLVAASGITVVVGGVMDVSSTPDLVRAHNASLVITPSSVSLAGTF